MFLARLLCAIIGIAMTTVLTLIGYKGILNGYIKPFRMQRWTEPDIIDKNDSNFRFWFCVCSYFAFAIAMFIVTILTLLGKLKIR